MLQFADFDIRRFLLDWFSCWILTFTVRFPRPCSPTKKRVNLKLLNVLTWLNLCETAIHTEESMYNTTFPRLAPVKKREYISLFSRNIAVNILTPVGDLLYRISYCIWTFREHQLWVFRVLVYQRRNMNFKWLNICPWMNLCETAIHTEASMRNTVFPRPGSQTKKRELEIG